MAAGEEEEHVGWAPKGALASESAAVWGEEAQRSGETLAPPILASL